MICFKLAFDLFMQDCMTCSNRRPGLMIPEAFSCLMFLCMSAYSYSGKSSYFNRVSIIYLALFVF